jgi:hypothetical protein
MVGVSSLGLAIPGCSKVDVTTPDDITIDPKSIGSIAGKVIFPVIEGNFIVYRGVDETWVKLDNTDYKTKTLYDGTYSFTDVSAKSYTIVADRIYINYGYHGPAKQTVTVIEQKTIIVPDLIMLPTSNGIIHGIVYDYNKNPYANKTIMLVAKLTTAPTILASTTTSNRGEYAFYNPDYYSGYTWGPFAFQNKEKKELTIGNRTDPRFDSGFIKGMMAEDLFVPS